MRESKRKERTHLPADTTELWLESQKGAGGLGRHRSPPADSFEAWIEKRVEETLRHRKVSE